MEHRNTLGGVDADADGGEEVNERHLARRENGAARDAVLMGARGALEPPTGGDGVALSAATTRAMAWPLVSCQRIAKKV